MDQEREMQANFNSNINVLPIVFKEEDRESFTLKYRSDEDDLVLQIVPKHLIENAGARVAKAIADTIGEAGMSSVLIEEVNDKVFSTEDNFTASVYVRCLGFGTDYYQNLVFPNLFENLQGCLLAKQE